MKSLSYIRTLLALVAMLIAASTLHAQEDEYDYQHYKYYATHGEEEPTLYLYFSSRRRHTICSFAESMPKMGYSPAAMRYRWRGGDYLPHDYEADGMAIGYSAARLLRSLGVRSEGGVTALESFTLAEHAEHSYERHYLRGELSGRNYLGGLRYSATILPASVTPARDEDWHIGIFARARTGRDIYVEGVYTNAVDMGISLARSTRRSDLFVTLLAPWSERGMRLSSTEEAYSLLGDRLYNPAWGMQSGRVRNSRVATSLHPELLASWQWRVTATTNLNIAADIGYEYRTYSALMWFGARTPAPDNYRYMPSFQSDEAMRREVEHAWRSNDMRYTQIDWEELYHINSLQRDGRAAYIVEERCREPLFGTLRLGLNSKLGALHLDYGVEASLHTERRYKRIADLLGGDHIRDIDYFFIDDDTYTNGLRNNLREPDRELGEGSRFGYDYRLSRRRVMLYGMAEWGGEQMAASVGVRLGAEQMWRRGYFEKELFRGNGSYGRSSRVAFAPYCIDLAWSYVVAEHEVGLRAMARGESPETGMLFLQQEYNNRMVDGVSLRHTLTADAYYGYTTPTLIFGATAFVRRVWRASEVLHYYDDIAAKYVDAAVSNLAMFDYGVELSATVRYLRSFSSTFALSAAQYRYAKGAQVEIYADDDNRTIAQTYADMSRCHAPQPAITAYGDIVYRDAKGWSITLSLLYHGLRWVEPSVVRRTEYVLSFAASPEEREAILAQQRLPDAFTVDCGVGKRIRFRRGGTLYLQLWARNLLGSRVVSYGYERSRMRPQSDIAGVSSLIPFDNLRSYDYPLCINLSVGYRF